MRYPTYVVTNTGGVPLTGITVVDDDGTPYDPNDDITFTSANNAKLLSLAPGESVTLNATGVVVAGQYQNCARVLAAQQVSDAEISFYFGGAGASKSSKPKPGVVPKDDKTDAEKEARDALNDQQKTEKKAFDDAQKAEKKALEEAQKATDT